MAENKTKPTQASVSAFIATIADPTRQKEAKTLVKWMEQLSSEKARLWGASIIGVGSYHYKYDSGREGDMPIISFSPRKSATVLYSLMGFSGSEALLAKLGKHTTGKVLHPFDNCLRLFLSGWVRDRTDKPGHTGCRGFGFVLRHFRLHCV